jgi:hypothetical protein
MYFKVKSTPCQFSLVRNIISVYIYQCCGSSSRLTVVCSVNISTVRYHCGGWPEEVNTCYLNSYMVYL